MPGGHQRGYSEAVAGEAQRGMYEPLEKKLDFSIPHYSCRPTGMAADLEQKAPLLSTVLHSVTARNYHRNTVKVGAAHYPGICFCCCHLAKGEEP